jgi:hypothetical protein
MYAPGKIMKCGGEGTTGIIGSTWVVDLNNLDVDNPPAWLAASDLKIPRKNHNLVLLPDGKVLMVGGNNGSGFGGGPVLAAEMFDPSSGMWAEDASLATGFARPYHSTAVLLADGRVVAAGGLTPAHASAQIYKPPYITSGAPRPQLVGGPETMSYGEVYDFQYFKNGGEKVTHACLIRLASVTHGFDHDQRRVPITVHINGDEILPDLYEDQLTAPANANIAPPGYYMLFVMYEYASNQFAPCELAKYVRVGP